MWMDVKLSGDGSQDRIVSADDVYARHTTILSRTHLPLSSSPSTPRPPRLFTLKLIVNKITVYCLSCIFMLQSNILLLLLLLLFLLVLLLLPLRIKL